MENKKLKLPSLVSNGMILQRDINVNIFGWSAAFEKVKVHFIDSDYTANADKDGKWNVRLSSLKAGGPHKMIISSEEESIILEDILIGDVWLCSGQSNMQLPMERVKYLYKEEIANSYNPKIRQFLVPNVYEFNTPHEDIDNARWQIADTKSILEFTATGYFFGKTLFDKYEVPIGLINASWGGTKVQSWISEEGLKVFPEQLEAAYKFRDEELVNRIVAEDTTRIAKWYSLLDKLDAGFQKREKSWFHIDCNTSDWLPFDLPNDWEEQGIKPMHGVVWFRKEFEVPASMVGKPARLLIGRIVDSDYAYVNGIFVGNITYQYPPRIYNLPENLLKEGKNTIVLRVISAHNTGAFIKDKPYELIIGEEKIDLKGQWKYKIGAVMEPLAEQTFFNGYPMCLFNAMIAPLINYAIKGVAWYQGESNTGNPKDYHKMFSALITDWRRLWKQGDFPFVYVQLPKFMEAVVEPSESKWAELRAEQLKTLKVPNTAMAITLDAGEWNDLHPLNKKTVGYRLALVAQKIAYGEELVHSGPIYKSYIKIENKFVITFYNIGSGLIMKDSNELKGFAIAGNDGIYHWAKAKILNNVVEVWNESILDPKFIRYAWTDNPENANLYNKEGLPASPFEIKND